MPLDATQALDLPAGWLERSAAEHPARPALVTPAGEPIDYGQLLARTRGLAAALAAGGVRAGEALGVTGLPVLETALLLHAAARVGCALVPVDPLRPARWSTAIQSTSSLVLPGRLTRAPSQAVGGASTEGASTPG